MAAAARVERFLGQRIHGRDHIVKSQQYRNALNRWLRRDGPTASTSDVQAARNMLNDIVNALNGH